MGKKGRELLRGRPLSPDCYRATCSGVEYTENGTDYYGCYGLMDWPDNYNDECRECGAFVDNMPPYAEGGTVSENYIDGCESGSICPIPRTSVIFEGQKLTFDAEDSEKLRQLIDGHFRKLGGLR